MRLPRNGVGDHRNAMISTSSLVRTVVRATGRASTRLNGLSNLARRRTSGVTHVINLNTLGCFVLGISTHGGVAFGPGRSVSFGNGAKPFVRCACTHVRSMLHGTTRTNVIVPRVVPTNLRLDTGRRNLVRVLTSFGSIIGRTNSSCGPSVVTGCTCSLIGRCGRFCRSFDVLHRRGRTLGIFHLTLDTGINGVIGATVNLLNVRIPRHVWVTGGRGCCMM